MHQAPHPLLHRRRFERGFTLVEILIVVVIVGILATVTVFAVRSITDRGQEASCSADARIVAQAAEVYLAQNRLDVIPATGVGVDRFERTLVDAQFLREVSSLYELAADGSVTTSGVPCD